MFSRSTPRSSTPRWKWPPPRKGRRVARIMADNQGGRQTNRLMKALAGSVMALALAAAGAPAQETRIVVITHGQASETFWSVVKNGVDDAAELMGVEVQYQAPQTFDMVAMAQLIDAAVKCKPDGLVVSIPDADALGTPFVPQWPRASPWSRWIPGSTSARSSGRCCTWGSTSTPPGSPPARR